MWIHIILALDPNAQGGERYAGNHQFPNPTLSSNRKQAIAMIVPDSSNPAPLTRFTATLAAFEKKAGVRQSLSVIPPSLQAKSPLFLKVKPSSLDDDSHLTPRNTPHITPNS